MQIEYTGRQTGVTPRLRALAERRLGKLARLLGVVTRAHVTLIADKHRQIAEVSLHSRNLDLSAQEETADMVASLGLVIDKLERQAQRHAGKRKERKRRTPARGVAAPRAVAKGQVKKKPAAGRRRTAKAGPTRRVEPKA